MFLSNRASKKPSKMKLKLDSRKEENFREDLLKKLKDETIISANVATETRIADKRLMRFMHQHETERSMQEAILKAEQNRRQVEEQSAQEDKLTVELEAMKLDKIRDEKMRQQIRDNSLELRELEAKLRAGYMNRERAAQIAEKEAIKAEKKRRDADMASKMKREHEMAEEAEARKESERWEACVEYHHELEKQLEEKEMKKQVAYEQFLKEKLDVDEIVRKIYEEDQREQELRLEKQQATQRFIEEFQAKREQWKRLERERQEEENRRIQKFADLQQYRENDRMSTQQCNDSTKALIQQQLADRIAQEQKRKEEREQILMELVLEEQEEAQQQKEKAENEKKLRQRIELQDTHRAQIEFKEMVRKAQQKEDDGFRRQMLAKFAEDDRIEQMNAQKRRMKQLEHKRAVEAMIEERRCEFEASKQREVDAMREEERLQQARRQIIEDERQRLLKEHATKLLGYLPKGVLTSSKDLDTFDDSFKRAYEAQKVDPFTEG